MTRTGTTQLLSGSPCNYNLRMLYLLAFLQVASFLQQPSVFLQAASFLQVASFLQQPSVFLQVASFLQAASFLQQPSVFLQVASFLQQPSAFLQVASFLQGASVLQHSFSSHCVVAVCAAIDADAPKQITTAKMATINFFIFCKFNCSYNSNLYCVGTHTRRQRQR